MHHSPQKVIWAGTGLNSHISQSHKHKRLGWMSMYTSQLICLSILASWKISSLNRQTPGNPIEEIHFISNIMLYRSNLQSSMPFFDSPVQPRMYAPQMMMTEIKSGKLKSYLSQLRRIFLPFFIWEPGLADSMSAPRHHLTKDFRNLRNNLFKENSISRILWLCSKVIKYKWE